ncbi:MAG: AMP-dependent synthetase, partial [Desulfobacterales bacterium]|nr:AMP-dependent synthetase [Desulfobacterales bacterium]
FNRHNVSGGGAVRLERFVPLEEPPVIDRNETTDKGYINQAAVLTHRADIVEALYAAIPPAGVNVVDA